MKETNLVTGTNVVASGNGGEVDTLGALKENDGAAVVGLSVTAVTGTTPTMDVTIEGKFGSVWIVIATFTQATGATSESKQIACCPRAVRAAYVLGGTSPDFTFTVDLHRSAS